MSSCSDGLEIQSHHSYSSQKYQNKGENFTGEYQVSSISEGIKESWNETLIKASG